MRPPNAVSRENRSFDGDVSSYRWRNFSPKQSNRLLAYSSLTLISNYERGPLGRMNVL
jgi:hypothetical protein